MRHLILLKNGSVITSQNVQRLIKTNYDTIKFILFNLKDTNSTFLLHKPYSYMKNFKKAEIDVEMVVIRNSMEAIENESPPEYAILKEIKMEIFNLDDFISYLHSLNKIRYTNKLSNSNETSDYDMICFTHFSVKVFDSKSCIYKNKIDGVASPTEILHSIKKIYNPIMMDNSYISISKSFWSITQDINQDNTLYGICYPYTKSFDFFYNDIFQLLSNIQSVYCASFVYDCKIIDLSDIDTDELFQFNFISGSLRFHDIWYPNFQYYLEYISYLGTIQTNLTMASELAEFNEINNRMKMDTKIQIEILTEKDGLMTIQHEIKSPKIITVPEFISLLNS